MIFRIMIKNSFQFFTTPEEIFTTRYMNGCFIRHETHFFKTWSAINFQLLQLMLHNPINISTSKRSMRNITVNKSFLSSIRIQNLICIFIPITWIKPNIKTVDESSTPNIIILPTVVINTSVRII